MIKLPTGKFDAGVSTGKPDCLDRRIVSKEAAKLVEVSGFGGYEWRGSPDGFDIAERRLSLGHGSDVPVAQFPARRRRVERLQCRPRTGEHDHRASSAPTAAARRSRRHGKHHARHARPDAADEEGHLLRRGRELERAVARRDRLVHRRADVIGDYYDMQFRIGITRGEGLRAGRRRAAPGRSGAGPHADVKAACDPCTWKSASGHVTATVQDSISCAVTYRWSAERDVRTPGRARRAGRRQQPGTVPGHDHVTCPSDNKTASDTVNIQVTAPPPAKQRTSSRTCTSTSTATRCGRRRRACSTKHRRDARRRTLRLEIEGHTATSARRIQPRARRSAGHLGAGLLTSRGIGADRLRTVSYGEERPKYDNAREETRRLNRRAALVVNLR
jgi:hypothetical protein